MFVGCDDTLIRVIIMIAMFTEMTFLGGLFDHGRSVPTYC